jgi:type III secretory pathway component EscS
VIPWLFETFGETTVAIAVIILIVLGILQAITGIGNRDDPFEESYFDQENRNSS